MIVDELIVRQPVQHARLTDGRVAYDDQLEQEILVGYALAFEYLIGHLS